MARLKRTKQKRKVKKLNTKGIVNNTALVFCLTGLALLLALTAFCSYYKNTNGKFQQPKEVVNKIVKNKQSEQSDRTKVTFSKTKIYKRTSQQVEKQNEDMNLPIDWRKPSEKINYPTITNDFWIDVNIQNQRVYLMAGNKKVYTMFCSTGTSSEPTPTGLFHIQAQKGTSFYNEKTGMGAKYWTSFKDNGVYLFHTVPTDANGNYMLNEAEKLGKRTGSHGCIRLSVPDAKFIYENVPQGTPVMIQSKGNIPNYDEIKN